MGKKGTSTSGMPPAKSMPSPKTLPPTSLPTCESKTHRFSLLFSQILFSADIGFFLFCCFVVVGFLAGPYCIDMRTRMCHWARGSSDWRLNTWTTVLCAVGPLQVWNFYLPENGPSIPILQPKNTHDIING